MEWPDSYWEQVEQEQARISARPYSDELGGDPEPITVEDVARIYDVPPHLLDPSLPPPPSRRGWLRRAIDRVFG